MLASSHFRTQTAPAYNAADWGVVRRERKTYVVELVIVIIVFVALAAIVLWVTEAIGKLIGPKATWSLFLVLLPAGLGFFFAAIEKPETAEINLLLYPLYSVLGLNAAILLGYFAVAPTAITGLIGVVYGWLKNLIRK